MPREKRNGRFYRPLAERKDVFHDYTGLDGVVHRRTPRQLLETISWLREEHNSSNYDTTNLEIAAEIIRRYCAEQGEPIGRSQAQAKYTQGLKRAAHTRRLEKLDKALEREDMVEYRKMRDKMLKDMGFKTT